MVDLPPGFRVVSDGNGQQIGGYAPKTATQPMRMVVDGTPTPLPPGFRVVSQPAAAPAQPPAPTPMTPQQAQGMDLPVPDGQGGIDPSFSPADRGQPMQPAKRAPEDGAGRALDIALQGDRQGVGELLGFPVDMASAVLNLGAMGVDAVVPGEQSLRFNNPVGGSGQINSMIEGAIPGEPFSYDEMTDAQRLGFEANRFGVQSMLPSGFLSNPMVRQALGKMAPAIAPKVEELSRPYRAGANMVNDTVAGVGAGVGYGAYDEYTPEPVKKALGPLGDVISSMGGSVGANLLQNLATGVGRVVTGSARNAAGGKVDTTLPQNPDGSFVNNKDADVAALYAQEMSSNPQAAAETIGTRANQMGANGPRAAIPSSGILSDDPGLVAYEKGFRLDPSLHKDFVTNQQATESAALNSAKQIAPETAIGRQFTDAVQGADAERVGQASARVRAAEQDLAGADERSMQLGAELTSKRGGQVPASERLDQAVVDNTLIPMQGESSRMFAAADPNGQSMVASDPMLEAASRVYQTLGDLNTPAKVIPQGLLQRIQGTAGEVVPASSVDTGLLDASGRPIMRDKPQTQTPNEVSVRSIVDALPELATTEERARRAGNYTLADNIRDLRRSMDTTLDQAAAPRPATPKTPVSTDLPPHVLDAAVREEMAPMLAGIRDEIRAGDSAFSTLPQALRGKLEDATAGNGFDADKWEQFLSSFDIYAANTKVPPALSRAIDSIDSAFNSPSIQYRRDEIRARIAAGWDTTVDGYRNGDPNLTPIDNWIDTHYEAAANPGDESLQNWKRSPTDLAALELVQRERRVAGSANENAIPGNKAAADAIAARQNYKDTVGTTFGGGPGEPARKLRQDFNLDRFGRSTTPPSQTAKRFLQPGQPEKAASLQRILEASPAGEQGRAAVSDYLAADLADAPGVVRPNGTLDKAAIERWAAKWGDEALDLSADFRAQLNGLIVRAGDNAADNSALATQLKEAQTALREVETNKGAIARVLGRDPVNAVSGILQSGDSENTMKEIVASIAGNESALNGLKASVREFLMERATTSAVQKIPGGENPLSFAKLDDLFKAHENALSQVFSPDEMNSLRAAHQFLAPLKNLEMRTVVGSQTSANDRLWEQVAKPMEVALKLRFGVLKGGGLMRTLGLWRQMMPNGDKAAMELIERMWFDPELAQHLLTRNVEQIGSARYNAKLIRLLSYGAGARDLNSGEDAAPTVDNSVEN